MGRRKGCKNKINNQEKQEQREKREKSGLINKKINSGMFVELLEQNLCGICDRVIDEITTDDNNKEIFEKMSGNEKRFIKMTMLGVIYLVEELLIDKNIIVNINQNNEDSNGEINRDYLDDNKDDWDEDEFDEDLEDVKYGDEDYCEASRDGRDVGDNEYGLGGNTVSIGRRIVRNVDNDSDWFDEYESEIFGIDE